jgi:hypothetical protein
MTAAAPTKPDFRHPDRPNIQRLVWADLWLRDHVEYFGPYRWRWVARIGAWWWLRKVRLKRETPDA